MKTIAQIYKSLFLSVSSLTHATEARLLAEKLGSVISLTERHFLPDERRQGTLRADHTKRPLRHGRLLDQFDNLTPSTFLMHTITQINKFI